MLCEKGKSNEKTWDEVTIIPPDAVGSKGDEAMLRGALNLFAGSKIRVLSPRRELWKGWLVDKNELFSEEFVPLEELARFITQPTHLIIIGGDVMDGIFSTKETLCRLAAAERVIQLGGRADVFSCSFRTGVAEEILEKIKSIGEQLRFHLRDMQSLQHFKQQTGLKADYFPDFAFLCERALTEKTKEINQQIREKKEAQYIAVGVNFCEHACKGFFEHPNVEQRKQYIAPIIDKIDFVLGKRACYVLVPHDIRSWEGHFSDEAHAMLAMEYIKAHCASDTVIKVDDFLPETEILSVLPELDIFISGRMHLDIAAIRSGVVPIGYIGNRTKSYRNIEKFKGMFMGRIGRNDLVVGTEEEFEQALSIAVRQNDELKECIAEKNRQHAAEMEGLINQYRSEIGLGKFTEDVENIFYRPLSTTESVRYVAGIFEDVKNLKAKLAEQKEEQETLRRAMEAQICEIEQDAIREQDKLKARLQRKEGHIELLLQSERDLKNEIQAMQSSRTWRVACLLHMPIVWLFPTGSKRRLFAKVFCKLLRHPIRSVKLLTPGRIRNFMLFLKEEGPEFVSNRMDESIQGNSIPKKELALEELTPDKPFEEYEKLVFKKEDAPKVSIVIPVYNQFAFTYNCLQSILKNSGDQIAYEIIIGNDCSTDDTARLQELAENVRIITNEENLRFLKNCNHAAKYAKGDYILFLNNDTQVQPNWLEPLVRLMEQDESIGMTGSKLVYADGTLQEAGGILWRDGSAWNYGHGANPEEPEYNYVKDVDYISGASILIRASLWKEIGGFDEYFAPAYCEDSDLAFEVRKRGYRVVFQPQSVVVHFEGISNGTDVSSGVKQYQIKNSRKLKKKWAVEFAGQNPNNVDVFRARERSKRKKIVVFIDHYVPHFDEDAGSKTIYQYLQMFVRKGYIVKFIGDNFYRHEPYTTALQQLGIEVLYGPYYAKHILEWIRRHKDQIDYIFLNRPHISVKYIDTICNETDIKTIYYGHDLHFLRNQREYELTGDKQKQKDSEDWLKKELYLMKKADISYYPSVIEEAEIHKMDPDIPVKAITAYVYDTFKEDIEYDFSKREGILFVGGFNHDPNTDAVLWFASEIWPLIHEKTDASFYIVGSHARKSVEELDGKDGIVFKGFVSDEELEALYARCKITVVPLRYGAGVKGKVVEALYNGMPVVTTSVGAEGIADIENAAVICDDPKAFAAETVKLYQDNRRLKELAVQTQKLIKARFSTEAVWNIIKEDFE